MLTGEAVTSGTYTLTGLRPGRKFVISLWTGNAFGEVETQSQPFQTPGEWNMHLPASRSENGSRSAQLGQLIVCNMQSAKRVLIIIIRYGCRASP